MSIADIAVFSLFFPVPGNYFADIKEYQVLHCELAANTELFEFQIKSNKKLQEEHNNNGHNQSIQVQIIALVLRGIVVVQV